MSKVEATLLHAIVDSVNIMKMTTNKDYTVSVTPSLFGRIMRDLPDYTIRGSNKSKKFTNIYYEGILFESMPILTRDLGWAVLEVKTEEDE
tara:strand:+ start:699 stop:971 length:273 start_codon:yes stop_codon:yes gene_type:complete